MNEQEESNEPEIEVSFDGDFGEDFSKRLGDQIGKLSGGGEASDGKVEDALGKGMEALKQVLGGVVNMAQEMMGPEVMKNLEAAQWLSQVTSSLEEAARQLREEGAVAPEKGGELTMFRDRVDAELGESKLQPQLAALQQRLDEALAIVRGGDDNAPAEQADRLLDSAGYFRAAAASIAPVTGSSDGNL